MLENQELEVADNATEIDQQIVAEDEQEAPQGELVADYYSRKKNY